MTSLIIRITRRWSRAGVIEKADEDIYEYGLELLIFTIINLAAILVSSAFTGKFLESLALLAVILPLQSFGGGFHAKTHLRCFLIMYIGWWSVIFILPLITTTVSIIMASAAVIIVFALAPVANENVKMSARQRRKMRLLVRIVAATGALVSAFFIYGLYKRIGIAMSMGLGITGLSMLIARGKNIANGIFV